MKKIIGLILIMALYGCSDPTGSASAQTPGLPQVAGNYICTGNCGDGPSDTITFMQDIYAYSVTQSDSTVRILAGSMICTGTISTDGTYDPICYWPSSLGISNTGTGKFSNDTLTISVFPTQYISKGMTASQATPMVLTRY